MVHVNVLSVVLVLALSLREVPAYYDAVVVDADAESRGEPDYELEPADCLQGKSSGPCRGFFSAYYFNSQTGRCEKFIWSGCGGNTNRFQSKGACEASCGGGRRGATVAPPECAAADTAACDDVTNKHCRVTRDAAGCPICDCQQREVVCNLPAMRGHCRALLPRWRYDAKARRCRLFHFGGCDGNGNNFQSERHCLSLCKGVTASSENIGQNKDE